MAAPRRSPSSSPPGLGAMSVSTRASCGAISLPIYLGAYLATVQPATEAKSNRRSRPRSPPDPSPRAEPGRPRLSGPAPIVRDERPLAWRLSHKSPSDPVRRSVMGRPIFKAAADRKQVGRHRRQPRESRDASTAQVPKLFGPIYATASMQPGAGGHATHGPHGSSLRRPASVAKVKHQTPASDGGCRSKVSAVQGEGDAVGAPL